MMGATVRRCRNDVYAAGAGCAFELFPLGCGDSVLIPSAPADFTPAGLHL